MQFTRPKIEIEKTNTDRVLEILIAIGMVAVWLLAALRYGNLPERIPSHFDSSGEITGWSSKSSIFLLPAIGTIVILLVYYIKRNPHWHNYPVKITTANAQKLYAASVNMLSWISLLCMLLFGFIEIIILEAASSKMIPWYFNGIWILVAALVIFPFYHIFRILQKK